MSNEEIVLTRAGYERLQRELDKLVNEEVPEMAARMAALRGESDQGQDPAFFDAMKEKNYLDERVSRLQSILAQATVIDEDPDPDSASPGDRVTVVDVDSGEEMTFDLLGGPEIIHGRRGVSLGSPVGKALLGQKKGATIEVQAPGGTHRYKILELSEIPPEE